MTRIHKHNVVQILVVTEGKGVVGNDDGEHFVYPGDIIYVPPEEKHWHGAAKDSTFSHYYFMDPNYVTTDFEK
jgi:quercetin dioxygenase-like cupin family protein